MNRIRHLPLVEWLRTTPLWNPVRSFVKMLVGLAGRIRAQAPERIESDAQDYWTRHAAPNMAHWRGEGGLTDDEFFAMGERNAERFRLFASALDFPTNDLRVMEWGCGGGTNLRALAAHATQMVGVEVTDESLDRTGKEVADVAPGLPYLPVLIDVAAPEAALGQVPDAVDVFVCLNVMEVVPSPEYGVRLLRIAKKSLRPGGMAIFQIRYQTGYSTKSARAFYGLNVTTMTSYRLDDFWQRCAETGLTPHLIELSPSEEVIGTRYAYFALTSAQA